MRVMVRRTSWPSRRMLPFTATVAPNSRKADAGSEIFRLRTSLDGTTHKDFPPTSRFDNLPARLSIKPSDMGSLAGSLPMLSKGRTAMCSSLAPNRFPGSRLRSEGNRSKATTRTSAAVATDPTHHCQAWLLGALEKKADSDACEMYFWSCPDFIVIVGARGSTEPLCTS